MKRRTKLAFRVLPDYTNGEEIMNMVTHIVGGSMGILILFLCVWKAYLQHSAVAVIGSVIYGISMISLYAASSIYHGLHTGTAKKVMQIIDHCAIYFLIAGTYTPIMLCAFIPQYPIIGWSVLAAEWLLCATAATLTAIDLKMFRVVSMVCYLFAGWGIIFFLPQTIRVLSMPGFLLLLSGGIVYSLGAILFGIGTKIRWIHAIFHIFVVVGSLLQFLSIILYVL